MTREEYNDFANALKNNYTIDFDKLPEFCDMAISALSTEGEYIKKADILNELGDTNMDILTDEVKEIVNGLPSYSIPDSAEDNTMEWLLYGYVTNEQIKNCTERYCCSKCHNIVSRDYRYFKYCPNCGRKAV